MEENLKLFEDAELKIAKYEPAFMTPQERAAKIAAQPKLHEITGDNQKDTSRAAALSARPSFKGLKLQIILTLENHPDGMTCSEVCQFLGKEKPSVSPRLVELENKGIVYAAGTRATNTGHQGTIYKLKDQYGY